MHLPYGDQALFVRTSLFRCAWAALVSHERGLRWSFPS